MSPLPSAALPEFLRGKLHYGFLVEFCSFKRAGGLAVRHDHDPVAYVQKLGQLRGYEYDGHAPRGELAHELIDVLFGVHVHAPRRLVQQENVRGAGQPAAYQHLLLVSAAQVADYLVQSRINETRRKVAEAIRRVEELTAKLRAKYSYFN